MTQERVGAPRAQPGAGQDLLTAAEGGEIRCPGMGPMEEAGRRKRKRSRPPLRGSYVTGTLSEIRRDHGFFLGEGRD